jgi:predicted RNase H-like nuclease (RuvC/YqgF family)
MSELTKALIEIGLEEIRTQRGHGMDKDEQIEALKAEVAALMAQNHFDYSRSHALRIEVEKLLNVAGIKFVNEDRKVRPQIERVKELTEKLRGKQKPVAWFRDKQGITTFLEHEPGPEYGSGWTPLYPKDSGASNE